MSDTNSAITEEQNSLIIELLHRIDLKSGKGFQNGDKAKLLTDVAQLQTEIKHVDKKMVQLENNINDKIVSNNALFNEKLHSMDITLTNIHNDIKKLPCDKRSKDLRDFNTRLNNARIETTKSPMKAITLVMQLLVAGGTLFSVAWIIVQMADKIK